MNKRKDVWVKVPETHKDIVRRLAEGHTAAEIGKQRGTTQNTVEAQIARMKDVYGAVNNVHLACIFLRKKIIE